MAGGARPRTSGIGQESGVSEPASGAGRGHPRARGAIASKRARVLRRGIGARDAEVARGAVDLTRRGRAGGAAVAARLTRKAACGSLGSSVCASRAGGARSDAGVVWGRLKKASGAIKASERVHERVHDRTRGA